MKPNPITLESKWACKLEEGVFIALLVYLMAFFFAIASDINGDPNEYIALARDFFSLKILANPGRFIGYPLFIKLTSLNLRYLNLTFFVQLVVFLYSIRFFAHSISRKPLVRIFIYLPGFLPAIAYLPKLIFPDSLVLSLFLLLIGALIRRRPALSGALIFLLIFIKLIFIFITILWGALFLKKFLSKVKNLVPIIYVGALVILIPGVYFFSPFALYQTAVQNPSFLESQERANPYPIDSTTKVICNKTPIILLDFVDANAITVHNADTLYMPIGMSLASKLGCSQHEIKAIQRQLVVNSLFADPLFHADKYLKRFVRDAFMFYDAPHILWMLSGKYQLQTNGKADDIFYHKSELTYFEWLKLSPIRQPSQVFLDIMVENYSFTQTIVSYFVLTCFLLGLILYFIVKKIPKNLILLLTILASYNFVITLFGFGYDRYLVINYFLWFSAIGIYADFLRDSFGNDTSSFLE
ncbi:hypothetical protein G6660_05315 [Polynucleobacter paneuropaeus]|nr:hypothetical protein [Polynucleobacter paneuropaeus]